MPVSFKSANISPSVVIARELTSEMLLLLLVDDHELNVSKGGSVVLTKDPESSFTPRLIVKVLPAQVL